ncbi:hypothetical protein BDL97_09G007900 [Sphagnum fallax]|nr:hypothetical protein BDL97_09G007900 [Sphagnum fallax]
MEGESYEEESLLDETPPLIGPSDATILESVQAKLKKQLLDKKQELDEKIYEQNVALKKATKNREEAGVQLYDLQCNLAGLHLSLHKATTELHTTSDAHLKVKEELDKQGAKHALRSAEHKTLHEKVELTRLELDNLQNTLKQLEHFVEKIKGEIALSRRATYVGEEIVLKAEKEKKEQDYLIDLLQQRIKHLHEKQALLKAQLSAQERESKVAYVALAEAGIEMETMNHEKKQVTSQWQSSLIVLARCDQALQAMLDAVVAQNEQAISIDGEKNNYKKVIMVEQDKAERQGVTLMKIDSAMKEVQKRIQQTVKKRMKMLEHYAKILLKVEEVEGNIEKVNAEIATFEFEIKVINKAFFKETSKIQVLEDEILTKLLEQVCLEQKSAYATVANTVNLRKLVKKEDTMATEINFDLARIRVDVLAVMSYNQEVSAALRAINTEVEDKCAQIVKLQAEIKRRFQEVDMKTKEFDRLTKQYEKLTHGLNDKATTPWEAMINSLKTEIDLKSKSSSELQKQWLGVQTILVGIQTENNNLTEKIQKLRNDKVMLVARKQRVDSQFESLAKATKDFKMVIRVKQNLIIRLNDLISKNVCLQQTLGEDNENLQIDHYIALKDMASETMQLQVELEEFQNEKEYASRHMSQLEHHVLLWKYKISYELQIQAAIDPNVGQSVLTAMKKEVERLQLKHDGLLLERKKLIAGLESRIDNRKTISIRVEVTSQKKGVDGPASLESGLFRTCAELRKSIHDTDGNAVALDQLLQELEQLRGSLNIKVVEMDNQNAAIALQEEDLRTQLRQVLGTKVKLLMMTSMHQRMVRRHEDYRSKKWKGISIKKDLVSDVRDTRLKCNQLNRLVDDFINKLPALQQKLDLMALQLELVVTVSR